MVQKTLLWDAGKNVTRQMRTKEEAHDYRYFPEPDIPPVVVTDQMLEEIKSALPELPDVRLQRFMTDLGLSEEDAIVLTENRYLADYYEQMLEKLNEPKAVANIILTEVLRVLNEQSITIREFTISVDRLADLVSLKLEDKVNSSAMQDIFNEMLTDDSSPEKLAKEMNLIQVSDSGFVEPIIEQVIEDNPDEVEKYKGGKKALIGFFIGQVMKKSQGKANPKQVRELVSQKLDV